jgi:hypothetical protein
MGRSSSFAAIPRESRQDFIWQWEPRTDSINWKLASAIDVDSIVREGNLSAVEFLVQSFVRCNVSRSDAERFGSKGALNLFLVMQLAVDYLMAQIHNYRQVAVQQNEDALSFWDSLSKSQAEVKTQGINLAQLNSELLELTNKNRVAAKRIRKLQRRVARLKHEQNQIMEIAPDPGFVNLEPTFRPMQTSHRLWTAPRAAADVTPSGEGRRHLSEGEIDPSGLRVAFVRTDRAGDSSDEPGALFPDRST